MLRKSNRIGHRDGVVINGDDDNGIVRWITGDKEYTFWTYADYIKPFIIDFLKEKFPGKLVVRELNQIDLSVPEENLSVEIQSTRVDNRNCPMYSAFEREIEKQINQNISSYHMCWFFFDSEFLRAMRNASRGMSINMVWFRNYMKEGKLKVFTVSHDGVVEEKQYNDFDFLSEVSQNCIIAAKTDDMILNDNKLKIYATIAKMYGFVQGEIEKFYDIWRDYCKINKIDSDDKNDSFIRFLGKQKAERPKLYHNILLAINNLPAINDMLGLITYQGGKIKFYASILGIFDVEGWSTSSATIFINRSDICQYIPGYMRNKEMWDKLKGHSLNSRQFENIVKNGIGNYFWYEENKNRIAVESNKEDFESSYAENNNTIKDVQTDKDKEVKNQADEDKEVNFEIKSKGQIITVNIRKDETAGW